MKTVVNHLTIPALHTKVQGLCFFSELASLQDAMQYILSKTLPERCQSRKFGAVVLRCIEADADVARQLKSLVLCSFLGNFDTVRADTRPRAECRLRLYEVLLDRHEAFNGWFKRLVETHRGLLIQYCLREYISFAIRDDPALCTIVGPLMNIERFSAITSHAMNAVRKYFDDMLSSEWTKLSMSIQEGDSIESDAMDAWFQDLVPILNECQKAMLQISYRRPKRALQQCFLTVQKNLSMVPNDELVQLYKKSHASSLLDQTDIEAYVVASFGGMSLANGGGAVPSSDTCTPKQVDQQPTLHFISQQQLSALTDLMQCFLPYASGGADVLRTILPWLVHFGASQAAINFAMVLNEPHAGERVLSDEQLRKRLILLREHQPHAYNLIQTVTRLTEEHRRVRTLSVLPVHYWRNQLDAIQTRFGTSIVLDSMLYFVFCDACGMIYSLVRDAHSVYKQSYMYGLRDAVVDYDADEIYCRNKSDACTAHPLRRVFLLGQVIRYERQTILLCPQVGCGMPMAFDPAYCNFNERGVACVDCTRSIHASKYRERDEQLLERYVAPMSEFVCCQLCMSDLTLPSDIYWYPHCVTLCRHHPNAAMRNRFHAGGADLLQELDSRETVIAFLREIDLHARSRHS